jgi:hypothetical protein
MGTFKIEIEGIGSHGQDRNKKEGEVVNFFENGPTTPDAIAKATLEILKFHGVYFPPSAKATITHWPGEPSEVVDDLLTGIRKGNF